VAEGTASNPAGPARPGRSGTATRPEGVSGGDRGRWTGGSPAPYAPMDARPRSRSARGKAAPPPPCLLAYCAGNLHRVWFQIATQHRGEQAVTDNAARRLTRSTILDRLASCPNFAFAEKMNSNSEHTGQIEPSLFYWMFRKIAPVLVFGAIIGGVVAFLSTHSPTTLRWLAVFGAGIFAALSILRFYWASSPNRKDEYQWSTYERAGTLVSGAAALGMGAKLAFPSALPGSSWHYFLGACFLAFVVRPCLACVGTRNAKSEQGGAGQPATRPVDEPEGGVKPQPETEGRSR
jgi:hypothetical protein